MSTASIAFTIANILVGVYGAHVDKRPLGKAWLQMSLALWFGCYIGMQMSHAT